MPLPFSREETATAANPVKSTTINAIQDAIIASADQLKWETPLFRIHQNWSAPMYAAWTATANGSATNVRVVSNTASLPGVWLRMRVASNVTPDLAAMESEQVSLGVWPADMRARLDFRVNGIGIAGVDVSAHIGLANQPQVIGTVEDFIGIKRTVASDNWFFRTGSTAGVFTSTDTGVSCNGTVKARIEVYGANDPDGARALCYLNDALVATHTTNLPTGDSLKICAMSVSNVVGAKDMYVSPMDYRALVIE